MMQVVSCPVCQLLVKFPDVIKAMFAFESAHERIDCAAEIWNIAIEDDK